MPDPYNLSDSPKQEKRRPRVTLLTVVGVLFLGFMVINVALTVVDSQRELEGAKLQPGDRIEYHYTITRDDGSVVETTEFHVAQRANRTHGFALADEQEYVPERATLNPQTPGLGWGHEVEENVSEAHVGQTVRVRTQGVTDWEPFPPQGLPRMLGPEAFQRFVFLQEPEAAQEEGNPGTQNFNLDQLEQAIGPVDNGTVYNPNQAFPPTWDIVFEEVNRDNRSVLLHHSVQDGQFFDVEGLPGGVTVILEDGETQLFYRVDLEEGAIFTIGPEDPILEAGFLPGSYHVAEVTDDSVSLEHSESMDPDSIGQAVHVEIRILQRV